MQDMRQKVFDVFKVEYKKHLAVIRRFLERPWGSDEIDPVRRAVHNLKGAAQAVALPEIQAVATQLSVFLSRLKNAHV